MSMPVETTEKKKSTHAIPGNVAEIYQGVMTDPDQKLETRSLELANVLQSTLDLGKLVKLFSDEVSEIVSHDSLEYLNEENGIDMVIGEPAVHSCSYQLVLLDKSLGELKVTRRSAFSMQDTEQLEALLCALVYPLRNALLYKRAIDTAYKDVVTGTNNRAALNSTLEREVDLARRHKSGLSVIMLDIDRFKQINDRYGHVAGDAVLKGLGDCLKECIRSSDIIFRYGGEEFVVVLSNTDLSGATLLANRIRQETESLGVNYEGQTVNITISAGVAAMENDDSTVSLLEKADQALYQAKESGRNCVISYRPADRDLAEAKAK